MRLTQYASLFGLFLLISSCATTYNNTTDIMSYEGVYHQWRGASIFEPCGSNESWGVIIESEYKTEFESTIVGLREEWREEEHDVFTDFPFYYLRVEAILLQRNWHGRRRLLISKIAIARTAAGEDYRCLPDNFFPQPVIG